MTDASVSGLRVAVDAMGGDHAPEAIVAGAAIAARSGIGVLLVGDSARISPLLPGDVQIPVVHASEVIAMDDPPGAVRRKSDASLRVALRMLADGRARGVVSCGNTGALLVGAVLDVGVLEGVERPAIATVLPRSDGGRFVLLDAGANVDCKPQQLASFGLLGAAYAEVLGLRDPRVGLLSNGEEGGKGNDLVRQTLPLLRELPIRCVGYVEPSAAFGGHCDVLVCDGFVGNAILKAVEGAAETVLHLLSEELRGAPVARAGAFLMRGALERFKQRIAWDAQGGGLFLGTRGVVVVGHGRANEVAVAAAIRHAHEAAGQGLVSGMQARLLQVGVAR